MLDHTHSGAADIVDVGILESDRTLGQRLRNAVDFIPAARCVGVWNNVEDGLKNITAFRPQMVLLDIDLPGRSAASTIEMIKRSEPSIQIIIIAQRADRDRINAALDAGASGYFVSTAAGTRNSSTHPFDHALTTASIACSVVDTLSSHRLPAANSNETDVPLTLRETEVARLITEGLTNKEIASRLDIGTSTVHSHMKKIFEKLRVRSRTEVAVKYLQVLRQQKPA